MSTRAMICRQNPDGTVISIYLQHDGYVGHAGKILNEHFSQPDQVDHLFALGDLSSIGPSAEIRSVSRLESGGYCHAYHRDLGEDWCATMPQEYRSVASVFRKNPSCDYVYLWTPEDGWRYSRLVTPEYGKAIVLHPIP